jgi:hypothetical protein
MYQRGDLYRLIEPLGSAQNIEIAIAAYKEVLQYKPMGGKSEWRRWANATEKLGDCYKQRMEGPAAENAALAAEAYDQALTVFTHEAYPDDYARVHALKNEAQARTGTILSGQRL